GVHVHRHPGRGCLAVDALQVGRALLSLGADPDPPRLPRDAGVVDVDVVVAKAQVDAGAGADGDVRVAGDVFERPEAGRDVVVAGGVQEERVGAGRGVVAAGGVPVERVEAKGGVEGAGGDVGHHVVAQP